MARVVGDGTVVLAFVSVGTGTIVERLGIVGFDPDGFCEVGDGFIVLAFQRVGPSHDFGTRRHSLA